MKMIKGLVLDLDDFLIHTNPLYVMAFKDIAKTLSFGHLLTEEEIEARVWEINTEVYKLHHTDRKLVWPEFLKRIGEEFDPGLTAMRSITESAEAIYTTTPELREGAIEFLKQAKERSLLIAINRQADREWTMFKLESTGILEYVDEVNCVESGAKTAESWIVASSLLGLSPSECAMAGDSKMSDIIPATEAGYKICCWLRTDWERALRGDLPETAIEITSLPEIMPRVLEYNAECALRKV